MARRGMSRQGRLYVAAVAAFTLKVKVCIALHCGDKRRRATAMHSVVPCHAGSDLKELLHM